ncbi:hypothetical protein OA085_01720 [Alphaproteobacteria bacterium]|nr:hypothetical protein [Alphaproteobacteria bacterium]
MNTLTDYFKESLDSQSPSMPVRIITGMIVILFGFIWLPLGLIGLLGLLWIVYVTKHPNTNIMEIETGDILAPMDGLVTLVDTNSGKKRIRISQKIHTNRLILMPCNGKIDINMFVDGLFLPFGISNAHTLNARREITVKQDINSFSLNVQNEVCIIAWGGPLARYLSSPISEGRIVKAGTPIAISLLYGELDILLPADYELTVTLGEFCIAGKTLLAK